MNNSINSRKNAAKAERRQQKVDAGSVASHYPQVSGIVINMIYNHNGGQKSLHRVVNFYPSSSALFKVNCLNKDCVDGGFDFTPVIIGMIKNRKAASKGNLCCEGDETSADHATVAYEVAVQYN